MADATMTTVAAVKEYYSDEVAKALWVYASPVIIIVGTIANFLAFLVLCRRNIRHSATSVFLRALAIYDTIVLWLGLGREWVLYKFDYEIYNINIVSCTLLGFLVYVFFEMSSNTLALITIERCATVLFPFRAKAWFTKKVALLLMLVVFIIMCGINAHNFWTFDIVHYNGTNHVVDEEAAMFSLCTPPEGAQSDFYSNIFVWIDLTFYCIIPCCVIVIANFIIIIRLCQLKGEMKDVKKERKHTRMSSTTLMLLVVTFVFVICTLPARIFIIYYVKNYNHLDPDIRARDRLIWCCLNLLMYINSAINFFLYILTKKKYRRELKAMLCCTTVQSFTFSQSDAFTKQSEF